MEKNKIILTYINRFTGGDPRVDIWGKNCNNRQLSEMRKNYPYLDIKRCKYEDLPLYLKEELDNINK